MPLLFSDRRRHEPKSHVCDRCGEVCSYSELVVSEDDGTGSGWYIYRRPQCKCESDAESSRRAEDQEKRLEQKQSMLMKASGVRGKHSRMTLASIKEDDGCRDAIRIVRSWIKGWPQNRGLVLYGLPGRGKSHFAAGITMAFVNHLIQAEFWTPVRMIDSMIRHGEESPKFTIQHFVDLPLLVLDDLDKLKLTDWGYQQLFRLIDERDNLERPMVITTNKCAQDLVPLIGDAAVSRLVGNSEWVELSGDDHRVGGDIWQPD